MRPTKVTQTPTYDFVEVFPGVRFDRDSRVVEVDARVGTDVHHPDTPDVYLEVVVSVPDTREYEALVMIDAAAEHVHAALLLAGFIPGSPGGWEERDGVLVSLEPTGDPVDVVFVMDRREIEPESWIVQGPQREPIDPLSWVFAGSRFRSFGGREIYLAGVEGTIVGLATFGSEMIAATALHHPESEIEAPAYLANTAEVPAFGQRVIVRIREAESK
jgi:hypothetical protein